jgi:DNA-binding NarL/FixJ family response regulator
MLSTKVRQARLHAVDCQRLMWQSPSKFLKRAGSGGRLKEQGIISATSGLLLSPRVLLSNCDPTLEREMVTLLQSQSCEVLLTADHHQTLIRIQAGDVDVLVLDLGMHPLESMLFSSEFQLAHLRSRTLILARSLEQAILATEAQADGVLMQPVEPDLLGKVIHQLLPGTGHIACPRRGCLSAAPVFEGSLSTRYSRINE